MPRWARVALYAVSRRRRTTSPGGWSAVPWTASVRSHAGNSDARSHDWLVDEHGVGDFCHPIAGPASTDRLNQASHERGLRTGDATLGLTRPGTGWSPAATARPRTAVTTARTAVPPGCRHGRRRLTRERASLGDLLLNGRRSAGRDCPQTLLGGELPPSLSQILPARGHVGRPSGDAQAGGRNRAGDEGSGVEASASRSQSTRRACDAREVPKSPGQGRPPVRHRTMAHGRQRRAGAHGLP